MIEVRLYANLAPVGRPLPHLESGTVGLEVMVNHGRGTLFSTPADGDRLGLIAAVSGG